MPPRRRVGLITDETINPRRADRNTAAADAGAGTVTNPTARGVDPQPGSGQGILDDFVDGPAGRIAAGVSTGGLSELGRLAGQDVGVEDAVAPLVTIPSKMAVNAASPVTGVSSQDVIGGAAAGVGDALGGVFSSPQSDFQARGMPVNTATGMFAADLARTQVAPPVAQAAQVNRSDFDAGMAAQAQSRAVQAGLAGAGAGLLSGMDPRTQQQARAVNMFEQAAAGQVPSAAAIQKHRGLEDAARQQLAMAASARGGAGAQIAARRAAARNLGDMSQRGVMDAAQLRAQEMAQARAGFADASGAQTAQTTNTLFGLGNLATQARGQDLTAAGQGLDLGLGQAQLDQQTGLANQDAVLQAQALEQAAQQAGIQGLLGFGELQQNAVLEPQRIQAAIEAAELSGEQQLRMALLGGLFQGVGGAASLFGLGG